MIQPGWACPVCGAREWRPAYRHREAAAPVAEAPLQPSASAYGTTLGPVARCLACGHGSVVESPAGDSLTEAYGEVSDTVSLEEEAGQVATARRALDLVARFTAPRRLVDLGCWTGSLLVAAGERGWDAVGIEPSAWAAARARERGASVAGRDLFQPGLPQGAFDVVTMCDVLEHVGDPAAAIRVAAGLLTERGVLYITVPNAGSAVARLLGRRWWSVLPMHLQYFTRASLRLLLERQGLAPRVMRTHAKVFTARYYAERLGGYSDGLARLAVAGATAVRLADRLVAPNLGDRLQVVATRRV